MGNTYSKEFKIRAVRLPQQQDVTCKEVAELGMSTASLHRWRREFRENENDAFPGRGNPNPEDERAKSFVGGREASTEFGRSQEVFVRRWAVMSTVRELGGPGPLDQNGA